jgi:hypothetical protein
MIPDEVGVVSFVLDSKRISVEVSDGHSIGVQAPQRNVFLFQRIVSGLLALISAHGYYLRYALLMLFSRITKMLSVA